MTLLLFFFIWHRDCRRILETTINVGCCTPELTLADYPTMDDRLSNEVLKSSGRLKQEVNNEQTSLFKF